MEGKRLILAALTVITLIALLSLIKVHRQEVGKEVDYDKTWEETAAKFPIIDLCPKFTDKIDYWKWGKTKDYGYMAVDIAFKEVKDPKEKAEAVKKTFENAGFEVYETEDDNPEKIEKYETVKHYIRLEKAVDVPGEEIKKVRVSIEWFELEYKMSHNVYIRITPRGN